METKELRQGNAVLYKNRVLIIQNIHKNSVNLTIKKTTDLKGNIIYQVKDWIDKNDISPVSLNADTLKRLGFRKEIDTRFRLMGNQRTIFVVRHVDKYYLAVDNAFNEVAELKNIHHLQNLAFFWFSINLSFK